ncbi:hypothetical protein DFH07DRAFT_173647 [Mycena maculata]|uniref:Uncharacterized protein n=1 Tax=Mycena maculata TaxID=230809 RepID=A0AAD7HZ69_9AGAR|nr:hypothetical protein DFH07DRAFT_173647 [Mycena maculata]
MVLLDRANTAITSDDWPAFHISDLNIMYKLHTAWSWADYVPPSFLSETSDQTLVEEDEEIDHSKPIMIGSGKCISRSAAGSSASGREPKRRLLPSELQQAFSSADDDDDDAVSSDSHISAVEDPEELARALGDEELDDRVWASGFLQITGRLLPALVQACTSIKS